MPIKTKKNLLTKTSLKNPQKILILGSGALKIGEAGEFDYSGTQAIKALKEEGCEVILVNPNVATIQTSQGLADSNYFLPVTVEFVEKVIQKEKPQAILLSFGGQTALNCGIALYRQGILKKYGVEVLGTPVQTIIDTEDRQIFSQRLASIGLKTAKGKIITSVAEGLAFADSQGYPVMMRTGFALGGTGSGVAKTKAELQVLLKKSLSTSPQIILEECLSGWKEIEYEVVRDKDDNCITVCNMENFDPVGVHTGESIVIAPSQTLDNHEYFQLRQISMDAIRELKIVGECNIQYAVNPSTFEYRIIEVNARLSRSSALASKATGYPLAYIAAKLALGKTLPELKNRITKETSAFFEPALDYVVIKMPRWDLDKYTRVNVDIGSEMKSVGEVMSIGRSFEEAIQKGSRMLNNGHLGVIDDQLLKFSQAQLLQQLEKVSPRRMFIVAAALAKGASLKKLNQITGIDFWFLAKLKNIVDGYQKLQSTSKLTKKLLLSSKQLGFADRQIARLRSQTPEDIRAKRLEQGVVPVIKRIDTMAGEFPAQTNYLYMTYLGSISDHVPNPKEKKIIVIGGGPYAIGTSVEFDWCAVNTVQTAKELGYAGVMINCNPETVSTDYDTSDYLYFEELSLERIQDIYDLELSPVVVSVGGQIPNNLALPLAKYGVPLLGTTAANIYRAEHRQTFSALLDQLDVPQPLWMEATSMDEALQLGRKMGFPILVRPSFVLSGKAMSVIESEAQLIHYLDVFDLNIADHPLVLTRFLRDAVECDFDGVANKGEVIASAISEHVESGGVHSGDSTMLLPSVTLSELVKQRISDSAAKIAKALEITGPFNMQCLIVDDLPYVIECNLRASRSVPFVSKVTNHNFMSLATAAMLNQKPTPVSQIEIPFQAVKSPQFSFHKLRGADPITRVEMSSTGEVAAFGQDMYEAYLKAILSTGISYPQRKAVLVSLGGLKGKLSFLKSCVRLQKLGFTLYATRGTAIFLYENGIEAHRVSKVTEAGRESVVELFTDHKLDFAVIVPGAQKEFTVENGATIETDGYVLRRMAVDYGIPIFSNTEAASFFVESVYRYDLEDLELKSWQEYLQSKNNNTST